MKIALYAAYHKLLDISDLETYGDEIDPESIECLFGLID